MSARSSNVSFTPGAGADVTSGLVTISAGSPRSVGWVRVVGFLGGEVGGVLKSPSLLTLCESEPEEAPTDSRFSSLQTTTETTTSSN